MYSTQVVVVNLKLFKQQLIFVTGHCTLENTNTLLDDFSKDTLLQNKSVLRTSPAETGICNASVRDKEDKQMDTLTKQMTEK